jgi:ribosomal subunit interface protein
MRQDLVDAAAGHHVSAKKEPHRIPILTPVIAAFVVNSILRECHQAACVGLMPINASTRRCAEADRYGYFIARIVMKITPQIRFRGMEPSPSVEEVIHERIGRLARFDDRITSCNVVVEAPHRHGHRGKIYHVRVDITVPGREIVAGRESEENHAHEDVYVAIRDSFNAAQRQLEDVARKMSGHRVKPHPETHHGTVVRLVPEEGFGFISGPDGREFFFRRESMASDSQWETLAVGNEVRFAEHEGEKGPYASAVMPA